MRPISLAVTILLVQLVVLESSAQVSVGVIGGLNIANLNGKDPDGNKIDFSTRAVGGAGAVVDISLSENASLVLEPMYLEKGANEADEEGSAALKATFVELPVLFRIAFGSASTRPYLFAGPSVGLRTSSELDFGDGSIDLKEVTSSTDVSLAFGGGVKFLLENFAICLGGRYALGVSDIFKGGTVTILGESFQISDADIKTNGVQIMLSILFPVGPEQ